MTDWQKFKLGDISEVIGGGTPSTKNYDFWNGDIPWLTPKDLSGYNNRYISRGERNITKLGLQNSSARMLPKGTVLLTSRAPIGYLAIAENDVCTNQGFKSIILKDGYCPEFFYYLLKNNIDYIIGMGSGSTFAEISGTQVKNLEFTVPPLDVQKKIAGVLGELDDKIELNNKINNNLEQQAQALFKSWFVDFEPFGGKMPDDWKIGAVDDIIELFDAQRIPLSSNQRENMEKIYPYYGATSLMDYVDNYIFDGKYLLLGEDGPVIDDKGFPILQYVWGKFWVNNHAHILQGKNGFNVESLYLFFKNKNIKGIVTGAVQPKINQANLRALPATIPSKTIMDKFNYTIKPLFDLIRKNREENIRLSAIRDTLLPKLMSGEIDVSNVDISALTSTDKLSFTK